MQSAAIVTTLKAQGPSLKTFVNYHLSIGFEQIFLMFDDPNDPDQALVSHIKGVKAIPVNKDVIKQWESLTKFKQYSAHLDTEVRARQTLNAQLALNMSLDEGLDWILHIDSDELFWINEKTIHPHLDRLNTEEIISARYLNFEGVPSKIHISDYFLEVDAFKKPRGLVAKQGIDILEHWVEKRKYFNFYNNGKSMCRVRSDMVPGDVHLWKSRENYIKTGKFFYPGILHYSCCGYEYFKNKYQILLANGYDASVFGKTDQKAKGFTVDFHATMAYKNNDEEKAKRIYNTQVLLPSDRIEYYTNLKIIDRLDVPSKLKM